jgi:hypothetical protein
MTLRRRSRAARWRAWLGELPVWRQAAVVAVPVAGLAALAYAGRRWVWRGVAVVADAVEEVADTVEDAAEDVADAARERAKAGAG